MWPSLTAMSPAETVKQSQLIPAATISLKEIFQTVHIMQVWAVQ